MTPPSHSSLSLSILSLITRFFLLNAVSFKYLITLPFFTHSFSSLLLLPSLCSQLPPSLHLFYLSFLSIIVLSFFTLSHKSIIAPFFTLSFLSIISFFLYSLSLSLSFFLVYNYSLFLYSVSLSYLLSPSLNLLVILMFPT